MLLGLCLLGLPAAAPSARAGVGPTPTPTPTEPEGPPTATPTDTDTPTPIPCEPDQLGQAAEFNGFLFGDVDHRNTGTEGRLAVGGDAAFRFYGLGGLLRSHLGDVLIVGGDLFFTDGSVLGGNIVFGGDAILERVSIPHGFARKESPLDLPTPVDFDARRDDLQALSTYLGSLPTNGTKIAEYWLGAAAQITLEGSDPSLNIFFVPDSDIEAASTLRLRVPIASTTLQAPIAPTVLVNIDGTSGEMADFRFFVDDRLHPYVIYNFYEATTLNLSGVNIEGTILAPYADVSFNNAVLHGTLIAESLDGEGELDLDLFTGCLPPPDEGPTPTPTELPPVDAPEIVTASVGSTTVVVEAEPGRGVYVMDAGPDRRPGTADDRLLGSAGGSARSQLVRVQLAEALRTGDRIFPLDVAGLRGPAVLVIPIELDTGLGRLGTATLAVLALAAVRRGRRRKHAL